MCKDIGRYDIQYDEFKEMCRKAWNENLIYLVSDVAKNIVFSMKVGTQIFKAVAKVNAVSI